MSLQVDKSENFDEYLEAKGNEIVTEEQHGDWSNVQS